MINAALACCFLLSHYGLSSEPRVKTGLDILASQNFEALAGKHVGLITNPTGITGDFRQDIDLFAKASNLKLVALYGPEHGVRGDSGAGAKVDDMKDPATGVSVFSLYGRTRKPTPEMLQGVDALVFDIQDIGSRSYTFISTMGLCMEAAADAHIPFYVLDRPNPMGGGKVEGNILDLQYKSFVGEFPITYCHGMTTGELAQMIEGEGWLGAGKHCDLHVVKMQGWRRSMLWADTGLPWVLTSPAIPRAETSLFYAVTGLVGELPFLNIGVGYTLPFELAGWPELAPGALAEDLKGRKLPGYVFRPMTWKPQYGARSPNLCTGVQIYIVDPRKADLTRLNFELLDAARKLSPTIDLFPTQEAKMFDRQVQAHVPGGQNIG
jgi:uncharacterized protein YbbC (DUF1343 family)